VFLTYITELDVDDEGTVDPFASSFMDELKKYLESMTAICEADMAYFTLQNNLLFLGVYGDKNVTQICEGRKTKLQTSSKVFQLVRHTSSTYTTMTKTWSPLKTLRFTRKSNY
jgi:hypothetical protein